LVQTISTLNKWVGVYFYTKLAELFIYSVSSLSFEVWQPNRVKSWSHYFFLMQYYSWGFNFIHQIYFWWKSWLTSGKLSWRKIKKDYYMIKVQLILNFVCMYDCTDWFVDWSTIYSHTKKTTNNQQSVGITYECSKLFPFIKDIT